MAYAEKRGKTGRGRNPWRVRWTLSDGSEASKSGFATKTGALEYGRAQETAIKNGVWTDPRKGNTPVGDWILAWWKRQNLAESTRAQYKSLINNHILPRWEHTPIATITAGALIEWEADLRAAGLSPSTIASIRRRMHTILDDAVDEKLIAANPARRKPRRGPVQEREDAETPESLFASPLEALLVAERMRRLSGRDDEYVFTLTGRDTGMRYGELIGLEEEYCLPLGRPVVIVWWQLQEVDGKFVKKPPKGGRAGRRTLHVGKRLYELLAQQKKRARGGYIFTTLRGAHPRRSNFARRLWRPACDGFFPEHGGEPEHPVLWLPTPSGPRLVTPAQLRAEPGLAQRCERWEPIVRGLTPHDLRHSHATAMAQDVLPEVVRCEQLGHKMRGMRRVYDHVTPEMHKRLVASLDRRWAKAEKEAAALREHGHPQDNVLALARRA